MSVEQPSVILVHSQNNGKLFSTCAGILQFILTMSLKCPNGSTTIRLRTFRLRHSVYRHFVYRHLVYYNTLAYGTVIHRTSVSANHYFHQFQLLLTLWIRFINSDSADTMIIQHIELSSIVAWESSLYFQLKMLYFHQSHFYLGRIPCNNPAPIDVVFISSLQLLFQQGKSQ